MRLKVQQFLLMHPFLRAILRPVRLVVRARKKKKLKEKMKAVEYLAETLREDPVLYVEEFEGRFCMSSKSDLFKRLVVNGTYEPQLVRICKELIDKDRDAIDVGANIGFFSVLFAKQLEAESRVLSIEPTERAISRLHENLKANNVENIVNVFEGVLADKSGSLTIKAVEGMEEYSSLGSMSHHAIKKEEYVEYSVTAMTLDELVEIFELEPGFIKIDVEGAEKKVIDGALMTLKKFRPVVLAEVNEELFKNNGTTIKEVLNVFSKLNYKVIDPIFPSLKPGVRTSGDILCVPQELTLGAVSSLYPEIN